MKINKLFIKSVGYSNLFAVIFLILLFVLLELNVFKFFFPSNDIINEGLIGFILVLFLLFFIYSYYLKYKKIKYGNIWLYIIDWNLSYIILYVPILMLFHLYFVKFIIYYIVINTFLALIQYYFKNKNH